ncbi:MAG: RluA family pseudouridine synthase [Spirochaetes bacterium]|nr:MAG: RluA family pseudouridine synthase [Spirochaetota bacterium]
MKDRNPADKGFISYLAGMDDCGRRIDRVVRKLLPECSLNQIYANLRKGKITLNSKRVPPSCRVNANDRIEIPVDLSPRIECKKSPVNKSLFRPKIDEIVVFENENILAVNKPHGMIVHGRNSLEELVSSYLIPRIRTSLSFKPGPLHRLDRNTTGILLFGKTIEGARRFSELLNENLCRKHYLALLDGKISGTMKWENFLIREGITRITRKGLPGRGKKALSVVTPLISEREKSLCMITIYTGRTHQIRAGAAIHGHPLTGDRKYGGSPFKGGYILHSAGLTLPKEDPLLGFRFLYAKPPPGTLKLLKDFFTEKRVNGIILKLALFISKNKK